MMGVTVKAVIRTTTRPTCFHLIFDSNHHHRNVHKTLLGLLSEVFSNIAPSSSQQSSATVDEMEALIQQPSPGNLIYEDENDNNDRNGDDDDDDDEDEDDDDKDSLEIVSPLPNDPFLHLGKLLKFCEPCSSQHHHQQHSFVPSTAVNRSAAALSVQESRDAPCTTETAADAADNASVRTGVELNSTISTTIDWWALRLEEVKEAAGSKMEEVKKSAVNFLEHANDQIQKLNDKKGTQLSKVEPTRKTKSETADTAGLTSSTERLLSFMSDECESSNSCEEDDSSVYTYVSITEMDGSDSRADRIYKALETTFMAVLFFAITMHILKRLGGVFAIERRNDPTIVMDGLDLCGEHDDEHEVFSFISFAPNNYHHDKR
jgi:hypothetical protein